MEFDHLALEFDRLALVDFIIENVAGTHDELDSLRPRTSQVRACSNCTATRNMPKQKLSEMVHIESDVDGMLSRLYDVSKDLKFWGDFSR